MEAENKKLLACQVDIDKRISSVAAEASEKIERQQEETRKALNELHGTKHRVAALESALGRIAKFLKQPEVHGLYQRFMASEKEQAPEQKRRRFAP